MPRKLPNPNVQPTPHFDGKREGVINDPLATAGSQRQVKAIADNVEDELTKLGIEARGKEGYETQEWILLDFGDIMVHVFNEENRDFYNLEKLWKDAPYVDVDNLA